jgi:hypothetical protein
VPLPSGQKLALGLLATITLEVVPFHEYAQFPVLLLFFNCITEVVICAGRQQASDSALITSIFKKRFILHQGNREK